MATDTPSKDGDVVTARDGHKASPAARIGTPRGTPIGTPRGTPRATPKIATPANDEKPDRSTPAAAEPTEPKSIDKRNGDKDAQVNGDAAADTTAGFRDDVEIDEFIDHRVDEATSTVDIQVKWEGGETTWETEWSLQEQVPTLVFKYWDKLDGRDAATSLDIYHVFKILKRTSLPGKSKKPQYMYQVQWVGYRRTDSTWEHEDKLREIAPAELEKFEAKEMANGAGAQKRKNARGPGRPRKRARADSD